MRHAGRGGLVYSTEAGAMCPGCRQPVAACSCKQQAAAAAAKPPGAVRVTRETQGRGGKAVTVVRGLAVDEATLQALGKRLRTACGAGGTVKNGTLEVQGDHADRAVAFLLAEGYAAKRAGG
jgi:translation initiation factor 1